MLIRCVDLSEKHNARMVHLGAVTLLCRVMNELDQPQEAYRILTSIMPYVNLKTSRFNGQVIEAKDVHLEASSHLTLAESLLAMANEDVTTPEFVKARDLLIMAQKGIFRAGFSNGQDLSYLRIWRVNYPAWESWRPC